MESALGLRPVRPGRYPAGRADRRRHRGAGLAHRPQDRRADQRHPRQRSRVDHHPVRHPARPARAGQGLHHRLDHRQPAARAGGIHPGGRPQERHAEVRPPAHRQQHHPAGHRHPRAGHPVPLQPLHRLRHQPEGRSPQPVGGRGDDPAVRAGYRFLPQVKQSPQPGAASRAHTEPARMERAQVAARAGAGNRRDRVAERDPGGQR